MEDKGRINIRFKSDNKTLAQISYHESKQDFVVDVIGLAINESYSGSCICFVSKDAPKKDSEFWLKVGNMPILRAKCIWKKDVDEDLCRVGIHYLD